MLFSGKADLKVIRVIIDVKKATPSIKFGYAIKIQNIKNVLIYVILIFKFREQSNNSFSSTLQNFKIYCFNEFKK